MLDVSELRQAETELKALNQEISDLNERLKEENLRMSVELDVVRQLQEMILPSAQEFDGLKNLNIAGYMKPADEVGGDYYDILPQNELVHIGIGDVTGHGLESGVLMLMTQTAIRTLVEHGETDPTAFIKTLNRVIYKNAQRMNTEKSLTFVLINYEGGQVKVTGQHEEILVVRQSGQIERLDTIDLGFPIGLEAEIVDQLLSTSTVSLNPGDGVVLYTDGIPEAENMRGEFYGLDRLHQVISQNWSHPVEAVREAVVKDVTDFIGRQKVYDDLTLVIFKQV
jgi:serine phosphatase RsbU (regulator of sigma subunit)